MRFGLAKNDIYLNIVSEENRQKIDELEADILSGSIVVGTALGKTTEEIQEIKNSVRP